MSLYSLPKDILVQLVSTIGDDYKKEIEKLEKENEEIKIRLKLIREASNNSAYPIDLIYCKFPNCKAIMASNFRDKDATRNCEVIVFCEDCDESFCDKHLNENYLCEKCVQTKNDL
jgi:hypothetical protein